MVVFFIQNKCAYQDHVLSQLRSSGRRGEERLETFSDHGTETSRQLVENHADWMGPGPNQATDQPRGG